MDKKHKQTRRDGALVGGRPTNEKHYPPGTRFDGERFRMALNEQSMSLNELVAALREQEGIRTHRSTVWRWTQYRLYLEGSAPPLHVLRALERVLGRDLLKQLD